MSIGDVLRTAREEKGLSIPEVSSRIRVSKKYLQAVEDGNFLLIPSLVYAKGFVKAYGEFLGLDPKPLISELLERYRTREEPDKREAKEPRPSIRMPEIKISLSTRHYIYAALFLLVAGIVLIEISVPREAGPQKHAAVVTPEAVQAEKLKAAVQLPPVPQVLPDKKPGVKITGASSSNVQVFSDGVQVYNGLLDRGRWAIYRGKEIRVKAENGGAVRISLNGKELGLMGEEGKPAEFVYYPYK